MVIRTLRGLLCDLDGTLTDSEPLHCTAWLETLREFGLAYDAQWFEQWIGTSDRVLAQHVVAHDGLDSSDGALIALKQQRFHAAVNSHGKTFTGVDRALAQIAEAGFPLAIATNSGRMDADVMIHATRLDRYTSISVTASDVEHMKPAPDIYLLAAKRLGLPAAECIAIEDSAPGGEAALAAGCYLIGLTDKVTGANEHYRDNAEALRRAMELLSATA
ncbi:Fructose-1-phosphate phosphatase YqaB [Neolewinella maritima]|uniref:Fructose-1-phosphate phosphatase YqaB n=1 Tax=Neolewinella maritima TaxID=1383882 RepID=A0ABM9B4H0_9BACT|nr:HAD family phosphatase [Neolewinella maritima]CAH1002098.1 Fructose-1-phosphate phosphatase YqaB [Neolewinella maritima]